MVSFEQVCRNKLHNVGIDRIAKCFESPCWHFRQVLQLVKTLQSCTFAGSHITLLPSDDGNLGRRHRNEGWSSGWSLDANTGGPKLNHIVPNVTLLSLAIPL